MDNSGLMRERGSMKLLVMIMMSGVIASAHLIITFDGIAQTNAGDVSRGKNIFVKYCSGCHGTEGKGDGYRLLGPSPANLVAPATEERSDQDLLRTIHEGKPNMPSWKNRLSQKDSEDVLAFIRSLQRQ